MRLVSKTILRYKTGGNQLSLVADFYRKHMPIKLRYRIGKMRTASSEKRAFQRVQAGEWDEAYAAECAYMKDMGHIRTIPYKWTEDYIPDDIKVYREQASGMPYVVLGEKKLFFPKRYPDSYVRIYYNSILCEQDPRSPHYYFDSADPRLLDTTFVDVGGAEGYVSLNVIEQAKEIIILESDSDWIEALNKTFEPYKNKVSIVNKYASDCSGGDYIKLDDLLGNSDNIVLKLDVEGSEESVLKGASKTLEKSDTKVFVCTYHRPDDQTELVDFLKSYNFDVELSEGYMFYGGEDISFRKTMARGWRKFG